MKKPSDRLFPRDDKHIGKNEKKHLHPCSTIHIGLLFTK